MSPRQAALGADKLNLEKLKCLFVDDNMQSLDILGTICAGFGIRDTTKCQSADEAKAVLQRATYDFVMTDAQMPGTSGYDLVAWIRREALEANRFIPVIVVTGHTRISQILRARDCGSHFTLAKPVAPKTLLDRIFWVAQDDRPFVECDSYCGPDRRFKREGPPAGMDGRRRDDLTGEVGAAVEGNMSQDEINDMMKPARAAL